MNNIIKMPELNYVPSEYGLGHEIFYSMKKYQNLIAQVTPIIIFFNFVCISFVF